MTSAEIDETGVQTDTSENSYDLAGSPEKEKCSKA